MSLSAHRQLKLWLVVLIAVTHAATLHADQPAVPIDSIVLEDNLVMMTGRGGNVAVSHGVDGVIVVDDQYASQSGVLRAAIAALSATPLRFVINTHWHADHTGSNASLSAGGGTIIAHENVRTRLRSDQVIEFFASDRPAAPREAWPVLTFATDLKIHFNNERIEIVHPGNAHTDGDAVIFFEHANVVHTGDIFFNGMYPFIDAGTGGSVSGMLAAVDYVLARINSDTRIIPGHGVLADRDDLVEYRLMLNTVYNLVATAMISGQGVEQVVAAKPTQLFDAKWGDGFLEPDTFVRMIFDSITRTTLQ